MKSMKFMIRLFLLLFVFVSVAETGCTAQKKSKKKKKGQEEVVEEAPKPVEEIDTSPCSKTGPDKMKTMENVSLYREHFKQGNYTDAMPHWRYVLANAPGIQKKTFTDGEKMYKKYMEDATDEAVKTAYFDSLTTLMDKRMECWGEEGYVIGKRGLDYYKYRGDKDKSFELLQKSMDLSGNDVSFAVLSPYLAMLLEKYQNKSLSLEQYSGKFDQVKGIIDYNIANNEKYGEKFKSVWDKWSETADRIADVEDFAGMENCEDAKRVYQKKYDENPNDPKTLKRIRAAMKKFGCANNSNPLYKTATAKLAEVDPSYSVLKEIANEFLQNEDYASAESYLDRAAGLATTNDQKASTVMTKANIYWKKGDYPSARKFAEEAASLRPNWGTPYILIGQLYASSGKKCGPGTGWDSQVVIWPALDSWYKAKKIDPESAEKAQKYINKYSVYLPLKQDGFMKGYTDGQAYTVGCWINRSTTVRLKKE